MNRICLMIACLLLVLFANAQEKKWRYSIGLDAFVADLVNIEELPSTATQNKNYGAVIPHVQAGRKLDEKWIITAGVGFIRHKSAFQLDYTEIPLVNHLEYLAVPMGVQYKLMNWDGNKSWRLEGSIWNKLLVYHESNLPDMMRDPIYVYPGFNWYVMNARLATRLEWTLKNQHSVSVTGFVSRDVTAYLSKGSFLDYLQPSRYLFGGLGLGYSL